MHIEPSIDELLILGAEKIRKNPKLFSQYINYILGVPLDSEEHKILEKRFMNERWRQDGYFKALFDICEYWEKHQDAIKGLKLNNFEGVRFMFKKFIQYRRDFFIYGCDLDIPITFEEIINLKTKKAKQKLRKELKK